MTQASRKKVRILSIDGGGIRGILPGVILRRVEEKLITASNGEIKRIADAFDLIAGTSTGGILACAYLIPEKIGSQTPKFTAQQAVDLYLERGDDIFDVSFKQKLKSLGGVIDEKYDADELEDALKDNFGDTKLKDLLKPCIITSYDIRNRNAFFFRKQRANDKENNFLVRDVARATSAAPTYFETARVKNDLGSPFPLIDGGVFVNNPALCAYSEARNLNFPERGINKPTAKDMVIVSIGTGSMQKSYEYKKAKNWGLVEWIQPIIDIMMSGNSETVDYHLKQIYDTLLTSDKTDYYRLEPQLGTASSDMDDASVENLKALEAAGQDFVQDDENDKTLTEIVNKLL